MKGFWAIFCSLLAIGASCTAYAGALGGWQGGRQQLDSACDLYQNQNSIIESMIDTCSSSLESQLDVISSKLDITDSQQIISQVTSLESKLGVCSTQIESELDIIESKIDQGSSSQLISQLENVASIIDAPSCAATPITSSTILSTPGAYCLANNISGDVAITGTGITFDLSGRTISGGTYGLNISGDQVTIRDGTIANAAQANIVITGNQCLIESCDLLGSGTSLLMIACSRNRINNCTARNAANTGFALMQTASTQVTNCNAIATQGAQDALGFASYYGTGNLFDSCSAQGVQSSAPASLFTAAGILVSHDTQSAIRQCSVSDVLSTVSAQAYGIYCGATTSTWSSLIDVSSGSQLYNGAIAINDSNNSMAIWAAYTGPGQQAAVASYNPTTNTWLSPHYFSNIGNAGSADIAINPAGNAIAVWSESVEIDPFNVFYYIFASRYNASTTSWLSTTTFSVTIGDNFSAAIPQIGIDGSGNGIAVWFIGTTVFSEIVASRYSAAGSSWSSTVTLSTSSLSGVNDTAHIAMNYGGNAMIIWPEHTIGIALVRYINGSGWQPKINLASGPDVYSSQIALNDANAAIAVWDEFIGANYRIMAASFNGTSWLTTATLTPSGENNEQPKIAIDYFGNGIATWQHYTLSGIAITVSRYDKQTNRWSTPITLATINSLATPQVAMDNVGNGIVIWTDNYQLYASRYDKFFNTWSVPAVVTPSSFQIDDNFLMMAINGSGNALISINNMSHNLIKSLSYTLINDACTQCIIANNLATDVRSLTGGTGIGYYLNACQNLFIDNTAYNNGTNYGLTTTCPGINIHSELDVIESKIEAIPSADLTPLISKIALCCTQIDSQLDRIESKIDRNDMQLSSQISALDSKLAVCCTQLDSQLDRIESKIDINDIQLSSQINAIDSKLAVCCTQLDSQLDHIESKIDFNDTQLSSQINAIDSKLAVCCTQLDSQLDRIESKIDRNDTQLSSQISALDSKLAVCCTQLDSQLDRIESKIDFNGTQLSSQINALDSKLAICCTQLDSQLDLIESKIDFNDTQLSSQLNAIDSKLAICCTKLDSQLDLIESKIDFNDTQLSSQLNAIDSKLAICCTQLDSQLDRIESKIDRNDTQISSQLNALDSKLAICCTQLDSQLDRIESKIDRNDTQISSQINAIDSKLAVCCTQLDSQLDRIESKIDFNDTQLSSQINALDSKLAVCCTQLDSQLDRIESKIDRNDTQISSQITSIDSKLAVCCTQLDSQLDRIESKIDRNSIQISAIDSKLAVCCTQLDSQLDRIESKIDLPSCAATPISTSTTLSTSGAYCLAGNISGGLSITGTGITLDLSGRTISGGTYGIDISGDQVTVRNGTIKNATSANVYLHGNKCLIDSCDLIGSTTGLYMYNCSRNTINDCCAMNNTAAGFSLMQSYTNNFTACKAMSTYANNLVYGFIAQSGVGNIFQACLATDTVSTTTNAYGFYNTEQADALIECQIAGIQSAASYAAYGITIPTTVAQTPYIAGTTTYVRTVNWSPNGQYLAVGGQSSLSDVQVYAFTGTALTLVATPSFDFGTSSIVLSVNWSPNGRYLAVGGQAATSGYNVHVYTFNNNSLALTATYNYGTTALSVDWSPDGRYLAVGGNAGTSDYDVQVYYFNGTSLNLTASYIWAVGSNPVGSVNWHPSGNYLAIKGGSNTSLLGYCVQVLSFNGTTSSLSFLTGQNPYTNITLGNIAWSPNGQYIAVPTSYSSIITPVFYIYQFNGSSLTQVASYSGSQDFSYYLYSVSWSPNSLYLALGLTSVNGTLAAKTRVFSFINSTLSLLNDITYGTGATAAVNTVDFAPNGIYLAAGGKAATSGSEIQIYNPVPQNVVQNNLVTNVHSVSGGNLGTGYSLNACANLFLDNTAYNNDTDNGFTSSCTGENISSQLDAIENTFGIKISTATTISSPGTYRLAGNIAGDIIINSSNVTLDCEGYIITPATTGITIGNANCTVKNGFVYGGSTGIYLNGSTNCTVVNMTFESQSSSGISLASACSNSLTNCTVRNNTSGSGINIDANSNNNTFYGCIIDGMSNAVNCLGVLSGGSMGNIFDSCEIRNLYGAPGCAVISGMRINDISRWRINNCKISNLYGTAIRTSAMEGYDNRTTNNIMNNIMITNIIGTDYMGGPFGMVFAAGLYNSYTNNVATNVTTKYSFGGTYYQVNNL